MKSSFTSDAKLLIEKIGNAAAWLNVAAERKDINLQELRESITKVCVLSLVTTSKFPELFPDKFMEQIATDILNDLKSQNLFEGDL